MWIIQFALQFEYAIIRIDILNKGYLKLGVLPNMMKIPVNAYKKFMDTIYEMEDEIFKKWEKQQEELYGHNP